MDMNNEQVICISEISFLSKCYKTIKSFERQIVLKCKFVAVIQGKYK